MEITEKDWADLERRNEELERFAFITAHDLRHPLSSMTGYLEVLNERLQARQEPGELLKRCLDTSAHMRALIEELLTIARSKADSRRLHPVNLEEALGRARENLSNLIGRSHTRVTHFPLPQVRGDFLLMVQVFQNLLANAIACCERPVPEISISAQENGEEWVIGVKDNGPGIPLERQKEIFQPHRKGMGLTFCKRALEFQGGRIWIESSEGAGSTFLFSLRAYD